MCKSKNIVGKIESGMGEKIVIVGVYGPGMERSENERDAFFGSVLMNVYMISVRMREL